MMVYLLLALVLLRAFNSEQRSLLKMFLFFKTFLLAVLFSCCYSSVNELYFHYDQTIVFVVVLLFNLDYWAWPGVKGLLVFIKKWHNNNYALTSDMTLELISFVITLMTMLVVKFVFLK